MALSLVAAALVAVEAGWLVGAFVAAWGIFGTMILNLLVRSLWHFGAEADRDRIRTVYAERRHAAEILAQQVAVLRRLAQSDKAAQPTAEDLNHIQSISEIYLQQHEETATLLRTQLEGEFKHIHSNGGSLEFDLSGLGSSVAPQGPGEIIAAIGECTRLLLTEAPTVNVRGTGNQEGWRISFTMAGTPNAEFEHTQTVKLARLGLTLTLRSFNHGSTCIHISCGSA